MSKILTPDDLLSALDIETPEEIDLLAIADYCGLTVIEKPLEGMEASLVGANGKGIITIKASSPNKRKRFSIGHEIGHWIIDKGRAAKLCKAPESLSSWSSVNPEQRANRFASDLVLPRSMLAPRLKDASVDIRTIESLSDTFNTSLMATTIKVVELGVKPACLVFSKCGEIKWNLKGPEVPKYLNLRPRIHASTLSHDLLKSDPGNKKSAESIDLDSWFENDRCEGHLITESAVVTAPGCVLTVLWWKDESFILGEDSEY